MSADQSIIDLTDEQEDMLHESYDDIEIVSQKLRKNDEPVVCKTKKKRSFPEVLEIADSPQRSKIGRRNNIVRYNNGSREEIVTAVLQAIPHETPQASSSNSITLNLPKPSPPILSPGFECPICLEKHKDNLVVTTCGHIFCKPCIKESLKASKQCAKCRKKLTAKSYHPIFI